MHKIAQQAFKCFIKIRPTPSRYQRKIVKAVSPIEHSIKTWSNPQTRWKSFLYPVNFLLGLSVLHWLGFKDEDLDKDTEMIMTLKRAILMQQRGDFDTAESILHLALRMAQQQQDHQAVIYCLDLMANLAFDQGLLDKAEKLFIHVLRSLIGKGVKKDSVEVIHINLKIARIKQLKADFDKAELGFTWCLEQIEKHKDDTPAAKLLYGVANDWYAQFLMDKGDYKTSLKFLEKAYKTCIETNGEQSNQTVIFLNDLATTSYRVNDFKQCAKYLREGIEIGKNLEDKSDLGILTVNLGLVMLEENILDEAKKFCKEAWHLGKKHGNFEIVEEANYCLNEITRVHNENSKK